MKPGGIPRILLVEDEPETADVLRQLLELKVSADVEIADSIRGARDRMQSSSYDLVTLDYRLPDGFSMEFLAEITSAEKHPPVIVITGQGDEEVASLAFQRGACGYVVKNERLAALLPQAVEKALKDFVLVRAVEAVRESEAFYRTLFDEAANALFIETPEGVIEDVNRAAAGMLGYTHDELVGTSALDLVPPGRRREFERAVATLLDGQTIEFENINKDGRTFPVQVSASEVITRRGTRYLISAWDMSERRLAQKELEDERAFKVDAMNAIPDIFVIADLSGSFNKWNKTLCEITGYSNEEIDAMRTFEFFSPEDFMRLMASVEAVVQTGEPRKLEVSLVSKDGRSNPYEVTGSLMRDAEGNPLAIAAVGRDISDRKRAEDALRNVIRETNERREEITALLASTRLVLEHKDFDTAAREIFNLCKKLVGSSVGYIALLGEEGGKSEVLLVEPESLRESFEATALMSVRSLSTPAFMSGKAFYENSFPQSRWANSVPEPHVRIDNLLAAPLLVDGKPAGMLGFANKPGGFSGRDALMASAFGEVASVALRDSRISSMLRSSEERFRSVAETALEAIICADSEANIIFWNAGAENIFGYAAEEMTGRPLTWILPERERQARPQSMMREGAGDTSAPARIFEMTGLKKDGGEFPMELSRSTWKSDTGETNFAVILRDVTTRKLAEEALRDSEELYRALLHTSPDAVLCFDISGTIVEASRRSAELYGCNSPAELIGMNALELVAPDESEKATYATGKVLEEGGIRDFEVNLVKRDGTAFIGEVSAAAIRDKDGNVSGYVDVVRDVTARKLAERELQVLNSELEGYAHIVSHDLKGPLSSLMAAALALRGLLKGELDEQAVRGVMELAGIIESNVTKSSVFIDDLLVLAEAGQKPYEVTKVDIGSVVERVVGERAQEIKSKRMKVMRDPDLGRVVASGTHMYQLFSNLIANAIKHNDSRKPEVSVSYAGRGSGGLHRYLVKDNGNGIDPAEIEKIFLPFFSGKTGDTGVGLATVDKIVSLYGGTIRAYNDNGACFELTLKDFAQV